MGSGIAAYWYDFNTYQLGDPLNYTTTLSIVTSRALEDGDNWYINVRPRDKVGHKSASTAHLGPFYIDTRAAQLRGLQRGHLPSRLVHRQRRLHRRRGVVGRPPPWSSQYKDKAGGSWALLRTWTDPAALRQLLLATGTPGHTYCFRTRATDDAGNLEAWPASRRRRRLHRRRHRPDGDGDGGHPGHPEPGRLRAAGAGQGDLGARLRRLRPTRTWTNVGGVLYGTRRRHAPAGSPLSPEFTITADTDGGDRDNVRDALLFRLPLVWRNGAVTLRAVVNDDHSVPEDDYADNEHSQAVTFLTTHTLCINMVRVHLHPTTSSIDDAGFWDIVEFVRRWYPVADVDIYRGHTVYPYWHGFGSEWSIGDDIIWPLQKVWDYANGHDDPDECYSRQVLWAWRTPTATCDDATPGIGKMPGYAAVGVMSLNDSGQWPTLSAAASWPTSSATTLAASTSSAPAASPTAAPSTGRIPTRAPAPAASRPWATPPPTTAGTGPWAAAIFEVITPTEAADLMSYNWKRFPSDYTYRALFGSLDLASSRAGSQPAAGVGRGRRVPAGLGRHHPARRTPPGWRRSIASPRPSRRILRESYLHSSAGRQHLQPGPARAPATPCSTPTPSARTDVTDQGDSPPTWSSSARSFPYNPATQRIVLYRDGAELGSRPSAPSAPVVTIQPPRRRRRLHQHHGHRLVRQRPGPASRRWPIRCSTAPTTAPPGRPIASGIYSNALQLLDAHRPARQRPGAHPRAGHRRREHRPGHHRPLQRGAAPAGAPHHPAARRQHPRAGHAAGAEPAWPSTPRTARSPTPRGSPGRWTSAAWWAPARSGSCPACRRPPRHHPHRPGLQRADRQHVGDGLLVLGQTRTTCRSDACRQ